MSGWPKLLPEGRTNGLMQKSKCPDRPNISEPNKTTPKTIKRKSVPKMNISQHSQTKSEVFSCILGAENETSDMKWVKERKNFRDRLQISLLILSKF